MAKKPDEISKALQEPFKAEDIEWRAQTVGMSGDKPYVMALAYVTNRAIQTRLDTVMGIDCWKNHFEKAPDGGVLCGISCKFGGEWVPKYDAAPNTDVEAVKGGISNAMKRAAVQWGIGRYLYNLEATFAECSLEKKQGWISATTKDKKRIWWKIPTLPKWALPADDKSESKGVDDVDDKPQDTVIITPEQVIEITKMLKGIGSNGIKTLEYYGVSHLNELSEAQYNELKATLQKRIQEIAATAETVKVGE